MEKQYHYIINYRKRVQSGTRTGGGITTVYFKYINNVLVGWYTDEELAKLLETLNSPTVQFLGDTRDVVPKNDLPEIWYVKVTADNIDYLNIWLGRNIKSNKIGGICGMAKFDSYGIRKSHNTTFVTKSSTYNFGEEISFETFKKYVLFI